jgi:uncharacterized protein involved in type VI secretion and phage assembly
MRGEFDPTAPLCGLFIGQVVDRADPQRLGRVRVRIRGIVEPASAWAFPLGTVGGGSDRRGFFAVPEKDAEVGILFHQGDVDQPYYLCGHWGRTSGGVEVPAPARSLSATETPQVRAFETGRFVLAFDDRSGTETLLIQDKAPGGCEIELDGTSMGITIKATSALLLQADGLINIQGATVVINGRVVLPGAKPI